MTESNYIKGAYGGSGLGARSFRAFVWTLVMVLILAVAAPFEAGAAKKKRSTKAKTTATTKKKSSGTTKKKSAASTTKKKSSASTTKKKSTSSSKKKASGTTSTSGSAMRAEAARIASMAKRSKAYGVIQGQ